MTDRTCSVPGCERPRRYKASGLCGTHAERLRIHGSLDKPSPPLRGRAAPGFMPLHPETCTISECGRRSQGRGLCKTHYDRWLATGQATGPIEQRRTNRDSVCAVDECTRGAKVRGWCRAHYQQWLLGETPSGMLIQPRERRDECSYYAAHTRLANDNGPASAHQCVDCGGQAADWSYDNSDPGELVDPSGLRYSLDWEHYSARCKRCHVRFDRSDRHAGHREADAS